MGFCNLLIAEYLYFLDTVKLLNTVLQAKTINIQFEVDLALACSSVNDTQTSFKCLQAENKKNERPDSALMSIDSLLLQSTHLEDSNFKNQFFVTKCSFQVNHCHTTFNPNKFLLYQ